MFDSMIVFRLSTLGNLVIECGNMDFSNFWVTHVRENIDTFIDLRMSRIYNFEKLNQRIEFT